MTDEVLSWDDSSNNRFIASGKGSMICNPISAYRTAAKDNPDVYSNLEMVKPPLGPNGPRRRRPDHVLRHLQLLQGPGAGQDFLYEMVADSRNGMEGSTGYNHPFLKAFTKKPMPVIGTRAQAAAAPGLPERHDVHRLPGPDDPTATGMYAKFIIPTMFAEVAKGKPVARRWTTRRRSCARSDASRVRP